MALSAAQSALFNAALAQRLRDGLLHAVLPGDVMQVCASGGPFVVEDVSAEQQRYDERQTVLTGPMFGPGMLAPRGDPARREASVMASFGLSPAAFERFRKLTPGTRRPLVVWPTDLEITSEPAGIRVNVSLPAGVYATVLLRELMKTG
jgi:tRNA pseudouridine13 synthase